MKLGFVAPEDFADKMNFVIREDSSNIKLTNLIYNNFTDVPDIIREKQNEFDVLLFAGIASYSYAKRNVKQNILWEYLPKRGETLVRAIFEASLKGYDIKNVSFDLYTLDELYESYRELGMDKDSIRIITYNLPFEDKLYTENIFLFHSENYKNNNIKCCITALYTVYKNLIKNNIPSVYVYPTYNVIRNSLKKIYLKYMANEVQKSQIVVMSIEINLPNEYSVLSKNEYFYMLEKMKISEKIYLFSHKIRAAIVEASYRNFILFSTKDIIEVETNQFSNIELLTQLEGRSFNTLSIGIGYGKTVDEAKNNANKGLSISKQYDISTAHIVYDENEILGPITADKRKIDSDTFIIDEKIQKIAEKSQISSNNIFKLFNLVKENRKNFFTSKEIAEKMNISVRSSDRMINKLELSGFAIIAGKKNVDATGRPSRIIKFNFDI